VLHLINPFGASFSSFPNIFLDVADYRACSASMYVEDLCFLPQIVISTIAQ